MAVVSPFNRILLASTWAASRLLWIVVFEMSKSESISDLLPECLFPKIINGVLSNFFYERDSFRKSFHMLPFLKIYIQKNLLNLKIYSLSVL